MLLLCCRGTFVSEPLSLKQSAWDYLLFFEFGDPNSFGHFNLLSLQNKCSIHKRRI